MGNAAIAKTWNCERCGEVIDADFEICWNCGSDTKGNPDPDFELETGRDTSWRAAPIDRCRRVAMKWLIITASVGLLSFPLQAWLADTEHEWIAAVAMITGYLGVPIAGFVYWMLLVFPLLGFGRKGKTPPSERDAIGLDCDSELSQGMKDESP